MNALVTGGAGFIGSHLVERLLAEGHTVTILDDLSTGRPENIPEDTTGRLTFVHVDIADASVQLAKYFDGIDWVFHLAAKADIVPSIVEPLQYFASNVDGTVHVLEASRQAGVKRFIYAASGSCYGMPEKYPTPETESIKPQYPYAFTKWAGEQTVFHWGTIYKLPVISLRFFNVYGPRSRTSGTYGAVFGTFLAQKLAGKPFTVVGDGNQSRDFTYVSDVVDAIMTVVVSDVTGEVFNVGSGNTYSVNRLVELLGGDVVYVPKRPGEPDSTLANISKIRKILGWEPHVTFEQGVGEILKHIEYWRQAPVWTPETIRAATKDWFTYLSAAEAK